VTSNAVFISYASEDAAAALRICATLRAAGIEVWIDQSELRGGEVWDRQIRKQIHECSLFIAVISTHSNARNEGYFRREWRLAVERSHDMADDTPFMLPVVIDDAQDSSARVPEKFREVQWTRLPAGQAPPAFVERVRCLLSPVETAEPSVAAGLRPPGTPGPAAAAGQRRPPGWRLPVLVFAVATALALGYVAITRLVPSQRSAAEAPEPVPATPTITAGQGAALQKSIAVLPFADMSEKKDQEYFADGMAEEILDLLAKLPELRVIGRTSSFQFKSRNEDLRTIGKKLGAAYLVEGSVRRSGSRIRVTAQLIDATSGTQLWADSYDREFGDVLSLQDQVAAGIARALQLAVVAEDARPRRPLQSTEAYTHYLRGRAALDRGEDNSGPEAVSELEQALTLDPGFTRAAEALALAHLTMLGGIVTGKTGWPALAVAVRRALQLDPNSALAHAILGLVYATGEYNWPAAEAELRQALALNTRDPVALYHVSWLAHNLGQHEEALRQQSLSVSIDPLSPDALQNGGIIQYLIGNLDAAEHGLRASMQISPTFAGNHTYLGQVFLQRGDARGALSEMLAEPVGGRDFGLTLAYHALGRKAESDAALARFTRTSGNLVPMNVAIAHAYRGERDQAFAWLEKAVDERDMLVGHKFWDEPKLEPLRSDPRYQALLRKLNRPAPNP
jgi:TolB-like protein/Tfp pilus assembly protein PilF